MDKKIKDRVLSQIKVEPTVNFCKSILRIPSFKTEETKVARYLAAYFRRRGYEVDLQEVEPGRFQTIATLKGTGGGKSLMLNGHIDIDPLAMGWIRDPWEPSWEGDRLYGAGGNNMKGGVTSIIAAAEAIRKSRAPMKGDLVVACVVGELQGGCGDRTRPQARSSDRRRHRGRARGRRRQHHHHPCGLGRAGYQHRRLLPAR